MITIKIINAKRIIKKEKGELISRFAPLFMDVKAKVESEVVKELERAFADRDIEVEIAIVKDEQ